MVLTEFNRKSLQTIDYIAINITIFMHIPYKCLYIWIEPRVFYDPRRYIFQCTNSTVMQYIECCILYAKIVIVNFRQQLLEFLPIIITITMTIGVIVGVLLLLLLFQASNTGLRCLAKTTETQQPFVWLVGRWSRSGNNIFSSNLCCYVVMLLMG